MIPADILNADMTTLARWMRGGLTWWADELRSMVPQGWLPRRPGAAALILAADGARLDQPDGSAPAPGDFPVRLHDHSCLTRSIVLPGMSRRDIEASVQIDGERHFPMPADSCLYAIGKHATLSDGTVEVYAAALPMDVARRVAATLGAARVRPLSLHLAPAVEAQRDRIDFLPAMRRAGLFEDSSSARSRWWMVVGFLFLLNAALFSWRDEAATARLREQVNGQQSAVLVAQRIRAQMRKAQIVARQAAHKRGRGDAASLLAAITRALPDGAWVQRYQQEGDTIRITGYRAPDVDVVGPLRRLPPILSVRSAQAEQAAASVAGQPFDLMLTMKEH